MKEQREMALFLLKEKVSKGDVISFVPTDKMHSKVLITNGKNIENISNLISKGFGYEPDEKGKAILLPIESSFIAGIIINELEQTLFKEKDVIQYKWI